MLVRRDKMEVPGSGYAILKSVCLAVIIAVVEFTTGVERAIAQPSHPGTLRPIPSELEDEMEPADTMAQVTSVAQLSDVRPTDWSYQALQSLTEQYGCVVGYVDKTYRGNRPLSRYEFAAGLNACLNKVQDLVAASTRENVRANDLEVLKTLQAEFAAELILLRGRVDALEAKANVLENQQFSTTTKLYGQVILGLQGRSANQADLNPRDGSLDTRDPANRVTLGHTTQLSLVTAFSAKDFLLVGLQAGNLNTGAGVNNPPYFLNDTYTRLGYEVDTQGQFRISDLTYRLLVSDRLAVIVGAAGVNPITVFRGPNRYESAGQGPISAFGQRNPILGLGSTQAGIGLDWQVARWISLQAVYSAGNGLALASDPSSSSGLFRGPYTAGLQLALTPTPRLDLTLNYLNAYSTNALLNTGIGDDLIGFVGSRFQTNAVGTTVTWRVNPKLSLGGWFGYTHSNVEVSGFDGAVDTQNWMVFLNLPNLWGPGNLAGLYVGQPPKITHSDLRQNGTPTLNIPSAISGTGGVSGGQPDTTLHTELFYRWRISDTLSITPGVLVLFNPVQTRSSDAIVVGTLRTTFTF